MNKEFSRRLIAWQKRHGRHDLPWQQTQDPYRVWLSEIMLQQTQVATVVPYYERFLARFPTLAGLAAAPVEEVMALWSGLGYYARARNLHRCARAVVERHGGEFPRSAEAIADLPGIGRSTANAIAVFCFGAREPILDGNVKRVLCRCFGVEGFPGDAAVDQALWGLAADLLPAEDCATYIQAQMDLGATICGRSRPRCEDCPVAGMCIARRDGRTGELPAARPRKALPERRTTVLLLIDGDAVLLERRPPAGIWGGLLAPPELAEGVAAVDLAARLGWRAGVFTALPPLSHTFTHFRLHLTPLLAAATAIPCTGEAALVRQPLAGIGAAALPTPIRRLLQGLPLPHPPARVHTGGARLA